jgi:hypothetical protein
LDVCHCEPTFGNGPIAFCTLFAVIQLRIINAVKTNAGDVATFNVVIFHDDAQAMLRLAALNENPLRRQTALRRNSGDFDPR